MTGFIAHDPCMLLTMALEAEGAADIEHKCLG